MRESGHTLREIAKAIGCSRTTLRAQGFNLGSLRRKFTKKEKTRMVTMRKRGSLLQEIAIKLDCSQGTVRGHVRHLGPIPALKRRPIKPKTPIPNMIRKRIVALRKRGYTFERIANLLRLVPSAVRSVVMRRGQPGPGRLRHHWQPTPEYKVARVIALRRAGSSLYHIAQLTGVSATTSMMILRRSGFPGRIRLLRMSGPMGSRVRGICRIPGCGVRHYGSGLCSTHEIHYRQGRINQHGNLLPLICEECGSKFPYTPQRKRCDRCRRVHKRTRAKHNRDYLLGYIDKNGKLLQFRCEQCGRKFRRWRKTRFCETCAEARPNMLRRERRLKARGSGSAR